MLPQDFIFSSFLLSNPETATTNFLLRSVRSQHM